MYSDLWQDGGVALVAQWIECFDFTGLDAYLTVKKLLEERQQ